MAAQIELFPAEHDAGLDNLIQASGSIAYSVVAQEVDEKTWAKLDETRLLQPLETVLQAKASYGDRDLHYLQAILVTTIWNRNDDVFDTREVWSARHTPEDKKFDYEHAAGDIIGHITSVRAITPDLVAIPDDTDPEKLPAKYHLLTGAVLYRVWDERPDLTKRMNKIVAELPDGKWYVSMECLFAGFDYALMSGKGEVTIVKRNKDTAFLTKHLRIYGGNGIYNGQRIGRLLRQILFTGKGLVRNPANPESDIFDGSTIACDFAGAKTIEKISDDFGNEVYLPDDQQGEHMATAAELNTQLESSKAEVTKLTTESMTVKASHEKVVAELAKANENVTTLTASENEAKASLTKATETITQKDAELAKLNSDLTVANERATKAEKDILEQSKTIANVQAELVVANTELTKSKAEQAKAARLQKVFATLNLDPKVEEQATTATTFLEAVADLTDDKFDKVLSIQPKFVKPIAKAEEAADPAAANATTETLDNAQVEQQQATVTVAAASMNILSKQIAAFCGGDK